MYNNWGRENTRQKKTKQRIGQKNTFAMREIADDGKKKLITLEYIVFLFCVFFLLFLMLLFVITLYIFS